MQILTGALLEVLELAAFDGSVDGLGVDKVPKSHRSVPDDDFLHFSLEGGEADERLDLGRWWIAADVQFREILIEIEDGKGSW